MQLAFINFQIAVHKHHGAHTNKSNVRENSLVSKAKQKLEEGC